MSARWLWALLLAACGDDVRGRVPADAPVAEPPGPGCVQRGERVATVPVAQLDSSVVLVTAAPGARRMFAVEQEGRVWVIGEGAPRLVLDLRDDAGGPVRASGEQGLLGLAFHPRFSETRRLFVYYTTRSANVVAEYHAGADDVIDRASARLVLSIPDRFANHNGGMIEMGPDGYLYIGTGDGGSANDPDGNGQNRFSLLGKLLRVDVDRPASGRTVAIPADNPFADGVGGAPEVYSYGLRNPWRWSFDEGTLYLADVGQDRYEELTVLAPGRARGADLGWQPYEAARCGLTGGCDPSGKIFPQLVRNHGTAPGAGWCSIIGGAVYRGACYPDLVGRYFFTDYCRGGLYSLRFAPDESHPAGGAVVDERQEEGSFPSRPASLYRGLGGELYLTTTGGGVYHLEARP